MSFNRLRRLLATNAVRLTILYSLIFGLLATGVVVYISTSSARLVIEQVRLSVDEEVRDLAGIYRRAGMPRLVRAIERRSRQPGANLYRIVDSRGTVRAGNVADLDPKVLRRPGWRLRPFRYDKVVGEPGLSPSAIGRVFDLPGGSKLLVGRDVGDAERFRRIVVRAASLSLGIMVLTGLLLTFFFGRAAMRRLDRVTASTRRIVGGDLGERLPVRGKADEFDRLSEAMNTVLARVESLNDGVRSMSDSIAHDLKTPLTRLRNRAEAGLRSKDESVREQTLNAVVADADGLIRTFDALLTISQTESGARTARLEPVDLAPLVAEMHELFEPSAEEAGMELTLNVDATANVRGNRELLAQAMTNLLDNALKYGATPLSISLKRRDSDVLIEITDSGAGIPVEKRDAVRERFVRLERSRTEPGSGIGLALVEAIVRLHGGTLELGDNEPGLQATIVLPAIA